ncbi:MAG TPA: AraC family transcriptional regulator [Phycisphaerae bacterium]|nr:AraC family transcriptional regulator [Phycisphaerae bacterium]
MAVSCTNHVVFRSPAVCICDFRCHPTDNGCSAEESSKHDDFVFVRRGLFVKHLGTRRVVADPNHVVFFNREEGYRVSHPVAGGDDCTTFHIRSDLLRPLLAERRQIVHDDERGGFRVMQVPCDSALHLRHWQLLRSIRQGVLSDVAVEEAALNLTEELFDHGIEPTGRPTRHRRYDTHRAHRDAADCVRQCLAADFENPLHIDDLARRVHLSPYHMCRLFREQTGRTIHAYRTQLRLRAALHRLAEDGDDLTGLALDLGFSDQSHFTHAFRRTFGVTPAAFRRSASTRLLHQTSKNLQA